MLSVTNLQQAFEGLAEYWFPKVIGQVNGQLLKVAKLKGEFLGHAHEEEDELFLVIKGRLRIETEDGQVELNEGDFVTVPRGRRHNPVAVEECWVLPVEPATTLHTGGVQSERTPKPFRSATVTSREPASLASGVEDLGRIMFRHGLLQEGAPIAIGAVVTSSSNIIGM